jgi:hypothetical protein
MRSSMVSTIGTPLLTLMACRKPATRAATAAPTNGEGEAVTECLRRADYCYVPCIVSDRERTDALKRECDRGQARACCWLDDLHWRVPEVLGREARLVDEPISEACEMGDSDACALLEQARKCQ